MLFSAVYIIILSVSGVLSEQTWVVTYSPERICALKGSSVDMRCTYSYPPHQTVRKTSWFIKYQPESGEPEDLSQDPEYNHRVEYLGNQNSDCTFRINQLRKSDSGTYRFGFWANNDTYTARSGVTLTVTDLQLMVNPDSVTERQSVMLTCSTTCTLTGSPAFIWYRDGSPLSFTGQRHQFTASWEDASSYTCAVRGYEHLPSPAVSLNVRYSPKRTSVSVSPSGDVVEGSSVTLTCSSEANPPVQGYTWFKKNDTGGWYIQDDSSSSYIIERITYWDAGEYYCGAENSLGRDWSPPINLKVLYSPKRTSVSVSPSGDVVEGSLVTLTCSSDANPPVQRYTFIKNRYSPSQKQNDYRSSYIIERITYLDAGEYYCGAVNSFGTDWSPTVNLKVLYPPKSTSVSVSPSGDVVEGGSVTLTCSSDANPPVQRYAWFKDNRAVSLETGAPEDSYTIKNITLQDAGGYICESGNGIGTNRSPPKRLEVQYAPKNTSVSVSPSGDVVEGSSVTLTCSSDANPLVQRYAWFKENDTGGWQAGSGRSLNFSNFKSWNSGQYYCESKNSHGAQNSSALRITVQGGQSLIMVAAVGTTAILALVFLGAVWVRYRRRKSSNETGHMEGDRQGNSSPVYANVLGTAMRRTATQGTDRDSSGDPLYSSVLPANVRNREGNLYSTVHKPLPQSEEDVQYASVTLHPPCAAPRSPAPSVVEDCVLYSTVRKQET